MKINSVFSSFNKQILLFVIAVLSSSYVFSSESSPSSSDASDNPGIQAFNDGRNKEAENYFLTTLKNPETKNNALIYLSKIALDNGNSEVAKDYIDQALAIAPTDAEEIRLSGDILCNLAQNASMFSALKLAKKCIAQYEAAVKLAPDNLAALDSTIRFHMTAPGIAGGSRSRGDELLERLQLLSPENANTIRVIMLAIDGEADAALTLANSLSEKEFQSARNQYDLAKFYRDRKDYNKARALYESLTTRISTREDKWFINDSFLQLGEILLAEKSDINRSIELIENYKVRNNNPRDDHYFWSSLSLAKAYKAIGNHQKYDELIASIKAEDYEQNSDFAKQFKAEMKANR